MAQSDEKKPAASARRKILADTMSSPEMAEHRRRNGIVLLPVGSFEMHGVHVGLACDTFISEAACRVMAAEWDAVVMPSVHYTFAGATAPFPGSVDVHPMAVAEYMIAVCRAILENGFKRLMLVGVHAPNHFVLQMVIRTVFKDTREVPVYFRAWEALRPFRDWVLGEYGKSYGEAAAYLAALHICGRHGEFDPAVGEDQELEHTSTSENLDALNRKGVLSPFLMVRPQDHVPRLAGLTLDDAPRLAEAFRKFTKEAVQDIPELYEKWQEEMRAALEEKPWD